jgi:hypothetical protein
LPDDYKIGNAGDGVPSPFLYRLLGAEGGEETGEDHDNIGDNSDKYVGTGNASNARSRSRSGVVTVQST